MYGHLGRAEALDAYPGCQPNLYITHEKLYIDTAEGLDTLRWWIRFTDGREPIVESGEHFGTKVGDLR